MVRRLRRLLPAVLCCAAPSVALAEIVPAGSRIVNVAGLTYGPSDARTTVQSNSVTLRVDAVLDVAIAPLNEQVVADPSAASVAVPFVVTNLGNASERFTLTAAAGGALTIVADAGSPAEVLRDVTLVPGESRTVFAVLPGPVEAATRVTATATASTGHGTPGTVVADAVIGRTGATATAEAMVVLREADAPTLTKSQAVRAPDGSARVVTGAVVTYQLQARFTAAAPAALVSDDMPAGTRFVPGSITLDGSTVAEAAAFDGRTVRVALGDVPAGGRVHIIQFQTTIN